MKYIYFINLIISIIIYYLFNQINKLKNQIKKIIEDSLINNNKLTDIVNCNKIIIDSFKNNIENDNDTSSNIINYDNSDINNIVENSSDENLNSVNHLDNIFNFKNNKNSDNVFFDNIVDDNIIDNVIDNIIDNVVNDNIIDNVVNDNVVDNNVVDDIVDANVVDNKKKNLSEISSDNIDDNIEIKYTKKILNKLKLNELQNIAKNKNIKIYYNKNNKEYSKTKKKLIEEILS